MSINSQTNQSDLHIKSKFKPAWWLKNRHLQTIVPRFYPVPCDFRVWHNQFDLSDGDFVEISWSRHTNDIEPGQPIVLVLHGLEGSIDSFYAKRMMNALYNNKWTSVLMHFRGCGSQTNRKAQTYHSGQTADVAEFITYLKQRFPNNPLYAVGFSLGGNVLAKYVGESENSQLEGAVVISAPLDLAICADAIGYGFATVYEKYLVDKLVVSTCKKIDYLQESFPIKLDVEDVKSIKTLIEFDEKITAPLNGFESGQDYYQKSSGNQFLKSCQTPTLIIHSIDDPFMTKDVIPTVDMLSDSVTLEVSNHGGHVGFLAGNNPFNPEFWAETRTVEFIQSLIATHK